MRPGRRFVLVEPLLTILDHISNLSLWLIEESDLYGVRDRIKRDLVSLAMTDTSAKRSNLKRGMATKYC
jgi:hypothetical protein